MGRRHRRVPDRRSRRRGRSRSEHLGHVRSRARPDLPRRGRRRRRRPLPPLGRGPRPHGRARYPGLPALALVGAPAADRPWRAQPRGRRVLPRAPRGLPGPRHRAVRDALPLGPAAGAPGRGRLARPRNRVPLRRVLGARGRGPRRPRRALDHDQRAGVRVVPQLLVGHAGAWPHRRHRGHARRAPPAARARARARRVPRASAAGEARHHEPHQQPEPGNRQRSGCRGDARRRHPVQPHLPRARLPRLVRRGRGPGVRDARHHRRGDR